MSYYEIIDPAFSEYIIPVCSLEVLYSGLRWGEGPVYFADARHLLFSDIPNSRILKWDEASGEVAVYRVDSNFSNGQTRDRQGRLVTCEHGARRVTRTEYDGSISVLADTYKGMRLNSPNDVVVTSDGAVWFTDPPYGILSDYEGHRGESEIGGCHVYRLSPDLKTLKIVADDFDKPNGLVFSADEKTLYVADSGRSHGEDRPHHVRQFDVGADGNLTGGEVFCEVEPGIPDGLRLDEKGRLWAAVANGVACFDTDGRLLGRVLTGEIVANICFGGPKRNRLFLTTERALMAVYLNTRGIQLP